MSKSRMRGRKSIWEPELFLLNQTETRSRMHTTADAIADSPNRSTVQTAARESELRREQRNSWSDSSGSVTSLSGWRGESESARWDGGRWRSSREAESHPPQSRPLPQT